MSEIVKTMKLRIYTGDTEDALFKELTSVYTNACNYISDYVFNNGFVLNLRYIKDDIGTIIAAPSIYPVVNHCTVDTDIPKSFV